MLRLESSKGLDLGVPARSPDSLGGGDSTPTYRGPGVVRGEVVRRRVRSGAGKTSMFDAIGVVLPNCDGGLVMAC
jgi:hypothetical protein